MDAWLDAVNTCAAASISNRWNDDCRVDARADDGHC